MDHIAPLIDQYLAFWSTVLSADLERYLIGAGGVFLAIGPKPRSLIPPKRGCRS